MKYLARLIAHILRRKKAVSTNAGWYEINEALPGSYVAAKLGYSETGCWYSRIGQHTRAHASYDAARQYVRKYGAGALPTFWSQDSRAQRTSAIKQKYLGAR